MASEALSYSTRNVPKIGQNVGNGVSQHKVPPAYLDICVIQEEAKNSDFILFTRGRARLCPLIYTLRGEF